MTEKRYTVAGWLSIALAVFLPLLFALGFAESFVGTNIMGIDDPSLDFNDLYTVLIAAVIIFVLMMLRRLLKERYGFTGADKPFLALIIWYIFFTITSFGMILFADTSWPAPDMASLTAFIIFFVVSMTSSGVIMIFLGLRLFKMKERKNELIKVFTYVTLIMGFAQVTVALSPFALILMPVWCVTAAMVFFREKDEEQIL